jgi:hypothetical protein
MAYKYSVGKRDFGDIEYENDPNTQIDFDEDYIALVASGSSVLVVSGSSRVGIGTTTPDYTLDVAGDIGVDQYIYHNGDADTWIRFNDDDITFKAGNLTFLDIEKKGSAPHEITINDGGNNIDFVVKGNGSNEGNPLFKCDASTGRVGINGVGSPDCELHVDGDIKLVGNDPRINIDGDTDSHPGLELSENGTRKWIIYNNYTNDNLTFKTNSAIRMSIEQDGNVGIATQSPGSGLQVNSSFATALAVKSADYTLTASDHTILVDCSSGNVTLTLPTAVGCVGRMYIIKRIDGTNNAANINSNGSEEIEGSTNPASVGAMSSIVIQSDNSGWWKMAEYVNPP